MRRTSAMRRALGRRAPTVPVPVSCGRLLRQSTRCALRLLPALAAFAWLIPALGQESQQPAASELPKRWLLVCCGLPGDQPHRERLTDACRRLIQSAEPVLGVSDDRLRVLAGDDQMRSELADQISSDVVAAGIGVCDKSTLAQSLHDLSESIDADDSCWVLLLGHAHLYGNQSQFNVLGPDLDQSEFAALTERIDCREQVFWITMPVSGFWVSPLRREGRVVIAATEADLEFTGTEMPYALADLLSGEGEHHLVEDIDGDDAVSLLDLYLATNLEIHERFQALERLQTEHAQLDDNGDGRGSEVQQQYLPEDQEESEDDGQGQSSTEVGDQKPPLITRASKDGFLSRQIRIRTPEEPQSEESQSEESQSEAPDPEAS